MPLIGSAGGDDDWEQPAPATTKRPQNKGPDSNARLLMPYSTGETSTNGESEPGPNPTRVFNLSRGKGSSEGGRTRTKHDQNNNWPAGEVRRTSSKLLRISLTIRVQEDMCQVCRSKIVKILLASLLCGVLARINPTSGRYNEPDSRHARDYFPPAAIGGFRECHGVAAS
jgi:hypothetical protein